ncbi:hypothetical protein IQ06DRAFT_260612 [Phaeosphaeriaceae sp. SRC1lsM3a]|nr:hypothetical protein IQ06DRAFT_260612 [Stagonospora sp. SRC1lsM3a]
MSQPRATFIKVPATPGYEQTQPVEPERRLADSEIRIEFCTEQDADKIAEGLYAIFPSVFWDKKEPLHLRPDDSTRQRLLAKRILPSLTEPNIKWIKAVNSAGQIMGIACWTAPGAPIDNYLHRSAVSSFRWQEKMKWTNAEIDEMWAHVSDEQWNGEILRYDDIRREVLGDEPHWFLAPLMTWPEFQGRGVGKKLLMWAIDQADATTPPTPMYLESAPTARAVYMHCGFVPAGKVNMVRRGPAVVGGLEDDGEKEPEVLKKAEQVSVEVVAQEMEADMVGR